MTNRLRWVTTLLTLSALALGSAALVQAIDRVVHAHVRTHVALTEIATLERSVARLREEAQRVGMWRETARLCRNVRLEPAGWQSYPVSISRDMPWEDVAQSLLIASNAMPRPGGYYFQPVKLRAARANTPQSAMQDETSSASQSPQTDEDLYHLNFQGHFLVPSRTLRTTP